MKKLFFLLLPLLSFSQQSKICGLNEAEIAATSKAITGIESTESKQTKLGYVYQTADLKLLFEKVGDSYKLNKVKGKSEAVKLVWVNFFNNSSESDIIKTNGSDIRLQKYQDKYYIEVYSCAN